MNSEIEKTYGNKVRIRVCGLCWHEDKLLLVNHALKSADFWAPPGGGVEFGETMEHALTREFKEETGLQVEVGHFLFGFEFIEDPLHAIELFFLVTDIGGKLITGEDPELNLIKDVAFMNSETLFKIPHYQRHSVFRHVNDLEELNKLNGFYHIKSSSR